MQASGDKEHGRQIRLSVHPESVFTEALPRFKEQMVAPASILFLVGLAVSGCPSQPQVSPLQGAA